MSPEENPPEDLSHPKSGKTSDPNDDPTQQPNSDLVDAMLADPIPVASEIHDDESLDNSPDGQLTGLAEKFAKKNNYPKLDNLAATGGAVGALVLGFMALSGSFITNFSIINGILGLSMGLWGLHSKKRKLAWIGIGLCLVGIILCLISVGDYVGDFLTPTEDDSF